MSIEKFGTEGGFNINRITVEFKYFSDVISVAIEMILIESQWNLNIFPT